jgi:hypothetical protein
MARPKIPRIHHLPGRITVIAARVEMVMGIRLWPIGLCNGRRNGVMAVPTDSGLGPMPQICCKHDFKGSCTGGSKNEFAMSIGLSLEKRLPVPAKDLYPGTGGRLGLVKIPLNKTAFPYRVGTELHAVCPS